MSNANTTLATTPQRGAAISRLNLVLALALIVQLAVVAVVYWPRTAATTGSGPLLSALNVDAVNGLTITDSSGGSIAFTHTATGWAVADTGGFPANSEKIEQILTKLQGITTDRTITRTRASHSRLEVAEDRFQRAIRLATSDGDLTLYLGTSAGAGATHVRLAGQDEVYLTGAISTWEVDTFPTSWLDTAYFRLDLDSIRAVTLQNASGLITFLPDSDEWTVADLTPGETPNAANIRSWVSRVASINLTRPLGATAQPDFGLDDPPATITILAVDDQGDEQTYTLLIGAKDLTSDTYPIKASNSEYYVAIAAFTGDEFVDKTRADFVTVAATDESQPETPPLLAPDDAPPGSDEQTDPPAENNTTE